MILGVVGEQQITSEKQDILTSFERTYLQVAEAEHQQKKINVIREVFASFC